MTITTDHNLKPRKRMSDIVSALSHVFMKRWGHAVPQLVAALLSKLEGCGFDFFIVSFVSVLIIQYRAGDKI